MHKIQIENQILIETTLTKTVTIQTENQTQVISQVANQGLNLVVSQVAIKIEAEEKM